MAHPSGGRCHRLAREMRDARDASPQNARFSPWRALARVLLRFPGSTKTRGDEMPASNDRTARHTRFASALALLLVGCGGAPAEDALPVLPVPHPGMFTVGDGGTTPAGGGDAAQTPADHGGADGQTIDASGMCTSAQQCKGYACDPVSQTCRTACGSASDCAPGHACTAAHTCVKLTTCSNDAPCMGYSCDPSLGVCRVHCSSSAPCAAGHLCDSAGVCSKQQACESSAECEGYACSGGVCRVTCSYLWHCSLGHYCSDGKCTPY